MCWGRLMVSSRAFRTGRAEHRTLNIEPGTLNIGLGGEGRIMTLPRADDSTSLYRPKLANHKERKEHRAAKQKLQERGHSCPPGDVEGTGGQECPRSCTALHCSQPASKLGYCSAGRQRRDRIARSIWNASSLLALS